MKKLIQIFGEIQNMLNPEEIDLYKDLIESIISQQLSVKAADTITKRFVGLFGNTFPRPENILEVPDNTIRGCGISYPKIKYIKGICTEIVQGNLNLDKLIDMSDEEVLSELIKLKGIGKWTAEMLLIFSLNRTDVFSLGDMGLRNAISKLYNIDKEDDAKILEISEKWKPYRSLACRYLWKSLDNERK